MLFIQRASKERHCRMASLIVFVLVAFLISSVHTCLPPEGWRPPTLSGSLDDADLVVYARAVNIVNATGSNGTPRLDAQVQCVLKNTHEVTVPGAIGVTQDTPVYCHNHLYNHHVGRTYLLMITPPADDQYYRFVGEMGAEEVEISSLMNRCDFASPSLPSSPPAGATCPAVDDSGPCVGAAGRLNPNEGFFSLLVLVGITLSLNRVVFW